MDSLTITDRITLEGYTFQPGMYVVVNGNDFDSTSITKQLADKIKHDYPHLVATKKPVEKTTQPKRKSKSSK